MSNYIPVKVKTKFIHSMGLPKYESEGAAGIDLRLNVEELNVPAHSTVMAPTGLFVEILSGYEIQIRPRSGLSLKTPLRIANSPGTIDSDYRGEIIILLHNTSNKDYKIYLGERIAQMVLKEVPKMVLIEDELSDTERGIKGFGSTGTI